MAIFNTVYGGWIINFATQGPCPNGFHVPLKDELDLLLSEYNGLGLSGQQSFREYLKMPLGGYRYGTNASIMHQGQWTMYASSSARDSIRPYILNMINGALNVSYDSKTTGYLIRPFSNSPIIPTSSWTKLFGTSIEAGGIFWNSSEGLISMSSDGQTWITIMDKNLGATTVWNNGDTLSEANCGKYYQRGNNYGFPRTGSVATSSTQVDASNHGPGNYYNSGTFITQSGSPANWDSSNNANLRGGVDGNVPVS